MNKVIITLLIFFPITLIGQNQTFKIDSLLTERITNFKVNESGFTRKSCTGFGVNSVGYLFWKTTSGMLMQKIEFIEYPKEEIKAYKPTSVNDDFFFSFFKDNKQELRLDKEMKRMQLDVKEVERNGIIVTGFPLTSHSCFRHIVLKTRKTDFSKKFDYFNLVKSLPSNKKELNINYEFNNDLMITKWDRLINSRIEKIEKSNKLELVSSN